MSNSINTREAKPTPDSAAKKARVSEDDDVTATEIVQRVRLLYFFPPENDVASLVSSVHMMWSLFRMLKPLQKLIHPSPCNYHYSSVCILQSGRRSIRS